MNFVFPTNEREIIAWRAVEHSIWKNSLYSKIYQKIFPEDASPNTIHQLGILGAMKELRLISFKKVPRMKQYEIMILDMGLFHDFHFQLEERYETAKINLNKKMEGVSKPRIYANGEPIDCTENQFLFLSYFTDTKNKTGNAKEITSWLEKGHKIVFDEREKFTNNWIKNTKRGIQNIIERAARGSGYQVKSGIKLRKV